MSRKFLHITIRFGINGVIMTIGTYMLIKLGIVIGIGYIITSAISYIIMIFINYLVSAQFVFKSKKSFKNLLHFLVSQGLAFLLFNMVNYVLYTSGLNKDYCFLIAIIFSTATNFIYNNFITFRR